MKNTTLELAAELRADNHVGKGASRRLRKQEQVPAIVYGGKQKPTNIIIAKNKIFKALENEAFYSQILTLIIDGKKQKTILRDIQRHPYKKEILHLDFQRVTENDVITMKIPLHFLNEETCVGVKAGGIISHNLVDLTIRCKAKDIPEAIDVDLANLELDKTLHLSELTLAKGIEIPELALGPEHDIGVVSVHAPKRAEEPSDAATDAAAEDNAEKAADEKDDKAKDKK